ncbi:hypothetical protein CEXT_677861 [Caerostris extrusa]|uniref:Uncharacterized protein n=1 Tax=Caerostris extrusa TaxID=172846 RepID=A0AAV4RC10_CAEEX|nr:hypothetical protein CEXT_677861 [Caerostris extrusa]
MTDYLQICKAFFPNVPNKMESIASTNTWKTLCLLSAKNRLCFFLHRVDMANTYRNDADERNTNNDFEEHVAEITPVNVLMW